MKKILYILPLFLLSSMLSAQEVALSYEITPQLNNQATMQIYLQSMTEQPKAIRAVNFSIAIPEGCAKITGQEGIFTEAWTDFLQEVQMTDKLDLSYGNWNYSHRWQYGSADPGMPGTSAIMAPAQGEAALEIMKINLEGTCVDKLYLEQQSENKVNQIGNGDILPINWTVIHPKTDLELQEGLKLEIFPNPVQDDLKLSFNGVREFTYQFELSTLDGKMLGQYELEPQASEELQIPMSHLPSAVYVLSISTENGERIPVETLKIVKK